MRFFAIATLFSLSAALPATDLAQQDNHVARDGLTQERAFSATMLFNTLHAWPETTLSDIGESCGYTATNLGNGNYRFNVSSSFPRRLGNIRWGIMAGHLLGGEVLARLVTRHNGTGEFTVRSKLEEFQMWAETEVN